MNKEPVGSIFGSENEAVEQVPEGKAATDGKKGRGRAWGSGGGLRGGAVPENQITRNRMLRLSAAVWRCAAISFIVVSGCLAAIDVYLAQLPKRVPYVIEVTPDGEARYYQDAVKLLEDWTPNESTQRYFMAHYIQDLRSVSSDNYENKRKVQSVYFRTIGQAAGDVDQFYRENDPTKRSGTETVKVPTEEVSVVRYSDTQWKVTWRETVIDRMGVVKQDTQYEALLTTAIYRPDTERRLRENPIGLYVTALDIDVLRDLR